MRTTSPHLFRILPTLAAAVTLGGTPGLCAFAAPPTPAPVSDNITCRMMQETLTRPRWLSLPMSRLVVNPNYTINGIATMPSVPPGGAARAIDLAYYVGEEPVQLPDFLSWVPVQLAGSRDSIAFGQNLDFTPSAWMTAGVQAYFTGGQVRLTPTKDYGSLNRQVTVDLDTSPSLLIQVPERTGLWALKVNDGGEDVPLVSDTTASGEQLVDVAAPTGWHGRKTFTIKLFAIGGPHTSVTVSRLQFIVQPARSPFAPETLTWDPHQIVSQVASRDGSLQVETTTALPDEATLAQRLHVVKTGSGSLRLMGQFTAGTMAWDAARQTLTLSGNRFHATLAVSRPARWLGVKPSVVGWGTGAGTANAKSGVWALSLDDIKPGEDIIVTARFTPTPAGATGVDAAAPALTAAQFAAALTRQETLWNKRLAVVPRPLDFTPRAVNPQGVTAADIRRTYDRAWVFLLSDSLPPMPENNDPYPQLAAGKPSLWNGGAPGARPSAQWESFLAMQAMALVDPQTAWNAYEGQMRLLGPDGSLNGEGLPSCHVQTVWGLYEATGDAARLRQLYPEIKRFLLWKIANPRWILNGSTPSDSKDNEFVVHALTDIDYAARIAAALHRPNETSLWQQQRAALAANFHHWFWQAPRGPMYRLYRASTGEKRGAGNPWNLQALILPPAILTAPERRSLLASYQDMTQKDLPFLIAGLTKFPDYECTWKGLVQYGQISEASVMAAAGMRDVTRAGEFSEDYDQATPPRPAGVRPSVFGSRHAIDDVFWHNGIIPDEGLPILVGMPGAAGVANLPVRGVPIRVQYGPRSVVILEGPGLRALRLPVGFTASRLSDGAPRWQGKIAQGAQVRLEEHR